MFAETAALRGAFGAPGRLLIVVAALGLAAPSWSAAPPARTKPKAPATAPAPKPPAKPSTYTVKRGPFRIEIEAAGVFAAEKMAEVAFRPEAWAELVVLSAVRPGTIVKKGDVVLRLDARKIDESIRDLEAGCELSELAIKLLAADLAALERSAPLDLAAARLAKKAADEDLERYRKIDRAMAVKSAKQALKRAEDLLAYQQEELRQLEKMYKADDLTEETEEIILKRQRDAVERARFALEAAKVKADRELNVDLPRRDIAVRDTAERQAITWEKTKAAAPVTLTRTRLELAKQKRAHEQAAEKLGKLRKDRQAMTVKSPIAGIVYSGPCVDGNWPKLSQPLRPGTKLAPHDVVMTIVQAEPIFVRAAVPEKQLHHLKPGVEGRAVPTGYPDRKLKAKVEQISPIPVSPGTFALRIAVDAPKDPPPLVPGMTCTVKLVPYEKKRALAVPAAAVFTDEKDDAKTFVYVRKKGAKPRKLAVKVVKRADKRVEIQADLEDGAVLLLQKPKQDK